MLAKKTELPLTPLDILATEERHSITRSDTTWPPLPTQEQLKDIQRQFPRYHPLLEIVRAWCPDEPARPALFRESLQHFNYSEPSQRKLAAQFRDAEIPFKIYDIPEIDRVSAKWTDPYLLGALGASPRNHVEKSKNNHFMYWNIGGRRDSNFVPPTEVVSMDFPSWAKLARRADEERLSNFSEHFYFMSNANPNENGKTFISRDLGMFSTRRENFFITNVAANKGIQCRFGMRGIISEAHYDSGRNMIAMVRGAKRYILTPPSTCGELGIIADRKHPSYRHSIIDWSDPAEAEAHGFARVAAIDTVVHTGEILYVPSFWFHYIISLNYSIQCNSRSGTPPRGEGKQDIESCFKEGLDFAAYDGKKKSLLRVA